MPNISDSDLVRRSLEGSQDAYGVLVTRYQRPVYGLIVRMVRNPGVAEELAQDVFLKAYGRLASFDPSRKFSSWLFKVAHNATIDHLRRRRVATVSLDPLGEEGLSISERLAGPERDGPERAAMRRELALALEEAMADLRPEHREILLLRFREGLSYEELAEVLGLALGTVKTHLHRARKRLAVVLGNSEWSPKE